MDIFFDHQIFERQQYGGISRYFFELIRRLSVLPDVAVTLFQGCHSNRYGLNEYRCFFGKYFSRGPLRPLPRTLVKLLNRSIAQMWLKSFNGIYHQTYYDYLYTDSNVCRVATVYDMIHEKFSSLFSATDPTMQRKKRAMHEAAGIICISEATKRDLISIMDVSNKEIRVIYPGITVYKEPDIPRVHTRPYILYVGERTHYKNFWSLYEAYCISGISSEFDLVCFGGPVFTTVELSKFSKNGQLDKIFHYIGADFVVSSLYSYASLFVYPSLSEGFGFPPLEALSLNCPVVAASSGSIPEVIGEAALYFDPKSINDLSCKIQSVLSDSTIRANLNLKAPEIISKYSWKSCVTQHLQFYRDISGERMSNDV